MRGDASRINASVLASYFNSRPCMRGDALQPAANPQTGYNFNSRPCMRGDLLPGLRQPPGYAFQFTPLHEGRHAGRSCARRAKGFQFTPLHEGRRYRERVDRNHAYFNSRPCMRGDSKRYAFSANLLFNPHKSSHSNSGVMYFAGTVLAIFNKIIA